MTSFNVTIPSALFAEYANAGHHLHPSPSAADLTQQWPDYFHGSTSPEQASDILSNAIWPISDRNMTEGFLKFHSVQSFTLPAGSIHTGDSCSMDATTFWNYSQNQRSPPSDYDPSTISSSASDYTYSYPKPPSALPTVRRRGRPRGESTITKNTTKPKRQCRSKKAKDEEEANQARTREKNRIAADKCRDKQRIAIKQLSSQHDSLEDQNRQLHRTLNDLVAERIALRNMLIEHGNCGCELIENYLRDTAARWVKKMEAEAVDVDDT